MKRALLLLAATAVLGACGDYVDDPSVVRRLAVLAVAAEPPEAAPGASVALSSLIADPKGGGRAIGGAWSVCLPLLLAPTSQVISEASCTVPANQLALGTGTSLTIAIPPDLLDGLPPAQQASGVDFPIAFEATAGGERSWAVKRVRVSTSASPNANPSVTGIAIDGADPGASPASATWGATLEVAGTISAGDTGDVFERFTWFVTAGGFGQENQSYSGDPAQWRTDGRRASPGTATLYGVAGDGRGGVAWAVRTVQF
jgi:hypothetical protein